METRMTAKVERDWAVEELSKKEKGLMGMDNSVVIAGGEGSMSVLNGNGKNYNNCFLNKGCCLCSSKG